MAETNEGETLQKKKTDINDNLQRCIEVRENYSEQTELLYTLEQILFERKLNYQEAFKEFHKIISTYNEYHANVEQIDKSMNQFYHDIQQLNLSDSNFPTNDEEELSHEEYEIEIKKSQKLLQTMKTINSAINFANEFDNLDEDMSEKISSISKRLEILEKRINNEKIKY